MTQLEQLPARVDGLTSQIQHLRTEMRAECSAVRGEIGEQVNGLRVVIAEQGTSLRAEIEEQGGRLGARMDTFEAKLDSHGVQMRVLHEEVLRRIALTQEGRPARPGSRRDGL